MTKDVYFQHKSFLALLQTFPALCSFFDRANKTLPRYSTCLFHIQLTSVKAQKYWLARSVLYFTVRFVADFFFITSSENLVNSDWSETRRAGEGTFRRHRNFAAISRKPKRGRRQVFCRSSAAIMKHAYRSNEKQAGQLD